MPSMLEMYFLSYINMQAETFGIKEKCTKRLHAWKVFCCKDDDVLREDEGVFVWFYVGCRVFQARTELPASSEELYATSPPSSSFTMKEGLVPPGLQPEWHDTVPISPGKNQGQLVSYNYSVPTAIGNVAMLAYLPRHVTKKAVTARYSQWR